MSNNEQNTPSYIRLLNLIGAIRELSAFQDLSADDEQLLGALTIRWHHQTTVTVGELMGEEDGTSPSTRYRRLISLRDKGFIDMPTDKIDKRVRLIVPTSSAKKYMKQLDQAIHKLAAEIGD
jgi:DNA-binding MarR family transcriptional regulator